MKDKKYTIEEIIDHVKKDEIEKFCNNVYDKMMPLISKVARPKLVIEWGIDDIETHHCGDFSFPCFIFIYPEACVNIVSKSLYDIDNASKDLCNILLFVIIHELSHANQDINLIETYDGFCKHDNSYKMIVEKDNDSRTLDLLEKYSEFILENFNIDIYDQFVLENNRCFYLLKDITIMRFIVMVVETFLMRDFESNEKVNSVMEFLITLHESLIDNKCWIIELVINGKSIILKSMNDNGIDPIYIDPEEITNWLIDNKFDVIGDFNKKILSIISDTDDESSDLYYTIKIDVEMEI